jgi:hypothetical protein
MCIKKTQFDQRFGFEPNILRFARARGSVVQVAAT